MGDSALGIPKGLLKDIAAVSNTKASMKLRATRHPIIISVRIASDQWTKDYADKALIPESLWYVPWPIILSQGFTVAKSRYNGSNGEQRILVISLFNCNPSIFNQLTQDSFSVGGTQPLIRNSGTNRTYFLASITQQKVADWDEDKFGGLGLLHDGWYWGRVLSQFLIRDTIKEDYPDTTGHSWCNWPKQGWSLCPSWSGKQSANHI